MNVSLRGSGRTTRMIEAAKAEAARGTDVYIIAATIPHLEYLKNMIGDIPNIKVRDFRTADNMGMDWSELKLGRAYKNYRLFVDHFVIESRFAPMLNMLHHFDLPPTQDNSMIELAKCIAVLDLPVDTKITEVSKLLLERLNANHQRIKELEYALQNADSK